MRMADLHVLDCGLPQRRDEQHQKQSHPSYYLQVFFDWCLCLERVLSVSCQAKRDKASSLVAVGCSFAC